MSEDARLPVLTLPGGIEIVCNVPEDLTTCYPAEFMNNVVPGCVFMMWMGEGDFKCTTIAAYRVSGGDNYLVYEDYQGSCGGCGNTIERLGVHSYIENQLSQRMRIFSSLDAAKAYLHEIVPASLRRA